MRLFSTLAIASAIVVAAPVAANAADLETRIPVSDNSDSLPVADGGFNWNGFYAGVYGVTQNSPVGGLQYGLGIDVGANARFEMVLVGGEIDYQGLTGGALSTSYLQGLGKFGVALSDNVVLYAAAGAGTDLGPLPDSDVLAGGGVEFALADNVSLDARYLHGFPLTGGNPKDQFTLGANFHF
jgi:outer membrane immunogenic protein